MLSETRREGDALRQAGENVFVMFSIFHDVDAEIVSKILRRYLKLVEHVFCVDGGDEIPFCFQNFVDEIWNERKWSFWNFVFRGFEFPLIFLVILSFVLESVKRGVCRTFCRPRPFWPLSLRPWES